MNSFEVLDDPSDVLVPVLEPEPSTTPVVVVATGPVEPLLLEDPPELPVVDVGVDTGGSEQPAPTITSATATARTVITIR